MTKIDPIIAVDDVNASADWYTAVFGCYRTHGGNEFAVLESAPGQVLICLHKWGEHEHPTMLDRNITPGNGLILYIKVDDLKKVRQNVAELGYPVREDIRENPNSRKMEFSLRDPNGYYLIITEYHNYEG